MTYSQNSEAEDLVIFLDVLFTVRFPLSITGRLAEEMSAHLSVCEEENGIILIMVMCSSSCHFSRGSKPGASQHVNKPGCE